MFWLRIKLIQFRQNILLIFIINKDTLATKEIHARGQFTLLVDWLKQEKLRKDSICENKFFFIKPLLLDVVVDIKA